MSIWRALSTGLVTGLSLALLPIGTAHAAPPSSQGCIVALYPRAGDAAALAIPDGEPVDDLHLTLLNVGIDGKPGADAELPGALGHIAATTAKPIDADVFGHAVINPDSSDFRPSVAYLVGDSPD